MPVEPINRDLTRTICIYYRWPSLLIRMETGVVYNWPDIRTIGRHTLNYFLNGLPDPLDESISEWLESHGWNCDTGWPPPQEQAQTVRAETFYAGTLADIFQQVRDQLTVRMFTAQEIANLYNAPPTTITAPNPSPWSPFFRWGG